MAHLIKNLPAVWETWVRSWVGKIPWQRDRLPTPVFWPREFHGLYSPWGHKELDTTERLLLHFKLFSKRACSVQLLSRVRLFATLWTAARQASLSIINSQSLLKFTSIELVMPYNHLILCHPFLLLPSIFPSIRVFSNESVFCIRWPKYCSFSIRPSNEYSGLISFRMDWLIYLQSKGLSRVFSNTSVQKHQFFGTQLSL